jgi:hypothetical protein
LRLGSGPAGVDECAIEYRRVSAKNALGIAQTLAPEAAFPRLFGTLVGVLGTEEVAALEIACRGDTIRVTAGFELGPDPVTLRIRAPDLLGHFAD